MVLVPYSLGHVIQAQVKASGCQLTGILAGHRAATSMKLALAACIRYATFLRQAHAFRVMLGATIQTLGQQTRARA